MDEANRAICFAMRNPGPGKKPMALKDIQKVVQKKKRGPNGKILRPTLAAISKAASSFKSKKAKRGRKKGQRCTTKADDRVIMKTFHKLRPPGHGIDSKILKKGLPKKVAKKASRRTLIRRLAEKGFVPEEKSSKTDLGRRLQEKRVKFCRPYRDWSRDDWKSHLQAVGDFKEFTWYPRELQPKFQRLRARWTYMTKREKKLPAFQRPKKWFPPKDWKKVKKMKVFGLTTSNGKQICFEVPYGKGKCDGDKFAAHVRSKIGPFLKKSFPGKRSFNVLLDGEGLQHTPNAKRAMTGFGITTLKNWPANSPELNPQEHVWSQAEPKLREKETGHDDFEPWKKKVLKSVEEYTGADKLVGGMERKIRECLQRNGAMIDS